jgi:hypothetical protein
MQEKQSCVNSGMQIVVMYSFPGTMLVVSGSAIPCGGGRLRQLAEGVFPPSRTISQRQSRILEMQSVMSLGKPKAYAMLSLSRD